MITSPTLLFLATTCVAGTTEWTPADSGTDASLRGLSVVDARVAWASGAGGTVLRTIDGATWKRVAVPGFETFDFRDVEAFSTERALILSAGAPTRMLLTEDGGESWEVVYANDDEAAFFDAMAFWDERRGLAFSDPVDGHLLVIATEDGGRTWDVIPADALPPSPVGEGGFAASGTCLCVAGENDAWIGTGGVVGARVFRTSDGGGSWGVADSSMGEGVASSGIFSLVFFGDGRGVAVGGDYSRLDHVATNALSTDDGGASWREPEASLSGYRSCVAAVARTSGPRLIAVGPSGSDTSPDGGRTWKRFSDEGFHAVASGDDGTVWASGADGRLARLERRAEWNRYRGPNGTGIASGGTYPTRIGPNTAVRWKHRFPEGFSSPILSERLVVLTGVEEERLFTYALDRDTGETVWRREAPRPRRTEFHEKNHAAAASAAIDDDTIVVFFDEFGLLAYDHDGNERWRRPLGPFDNVYGMGGSPVLVGDLVVLVCDQSTGSFVVALSKADGEERWRQPRPSAVSGHCTPVVWRSPAGRDQILAPGSLLLDAYDGETGERVWWIRGLPAEMKSVPVLLGDTLWLHGYAAPFNDLGQQIEIPTLSEWDADRNGRVSRGEIQDERLQRMMVFFDLDGDGALDPEEWDATRAMLAAVNAAFAAKVGGAGDVTDENVLWKYHVGVPQLPSPLVVDDVYTMLSDQGGLVTVLDAKTGGRIAKHRLTDAIDAYFASPVAADGKVYLLSESGILTVLPDDGGGVPLHTAEFGEACYATPALEAGRIWLRTASHLYCFE